MDKKFTPVFDTPVTTLSKESEEKLALLRADVIAIRKIGRLEKFLGSENYHVLKMVVTNPTSIAGLILLTFFIVLALAAPLIAPPLPNVDPYKIPRDGYNPEPKPPMTEWKKNVPVPFWYTPLTGKENYAHVMGTTAEQYDIFYGVVWGTRTALKTGITIEIAVLIIGIIVGAVSAYYGGVVDNIVMRIVDIFFTLPFIMAAMILAAVLMPRMGGRSVVPVVIALITFGWMGYARLLRGDILSVRERDYVMAARVIGMNDTRIMFKHIIPNAIFPTIVQASMDVGTYVLNFAALSFLGIGAELGYADWGQMLSFARDWITALEDYWYIVVYPGIILVLFVLAWNLVGDAVRDIMDPRMRNKRM
jgi:peptide/nickel transport system permease protein